MSDKRDYSKEIEEILKTYKPKNVIDEKQGYLFRSEVLEVMQQAINLAISEKEEESKQNAIEFVDWLKSDFGKTKQGAIKSTSELYDIFSPPTNIKPQ